MSGRSWSTEEENEMFQELSEKVTITQMALNHNRTEGAIRSRQRHMAARLFKSGELNIEEIMEKCRLNKKQVVMALESRAIKCNNTREAATQTNNTRETATQTDGEYVCCFP